MSKLTAAPPGAPEAEAEADADARAAEAAEAAKTAEAERLDVLAAHGLDLPDGHDGASLADHPGLRGALRLALDVTGAAQASLNVMGAQEQRCLVQVRGVDGAGGTEPVCVKTPREEALCEWGRTVMKLGATKVAPGGAGEQVLYTADASADPRWSDHPWVDGRRGAVRGFATAPLHTDDGYLLGSLNVFAAAPFTLGAEGLRALGDVALMASGVLGRRREVITAQRSAALAEQRRALLDLLYAESTSRTEMMDAVLDTIDVAVLACDASGSLTLFNRAAQEWHGGYPDPDVSAAEHSERYGWYESDGVTPLPFDQVPLHRALLGEDVTDAEIVLAPEGLPRRYALCSARTLTAVDGTVMGAVAAMADVSADRQRRAELQRSNTDLEHFAASASHDLAAPLAVIGGYLELIADECGPALGDRGAGWVETSRGGVERMQSLIAALLAYARAGGAELRTQTMYVAGATVAALADLEAAVSAASASIVLDDLPHVVADPVLVRQLVQNLVSNALNHRREHGACRVRLSAERAGSWWVISVADNGPGIVPSLRESVFDVFATGAKAGGTGERRSGGHGIGLATCRRTVERHGGRIWVEPTPGGGATVRFTLPAA